MCDCSSRNGVSFRPKGIVSVFVDQRKTVENTDDIHVPLEYTKHCTLYVNKLIWCDLTSTTIEADGIEKRWKKKKGQYVFVRMKPMKSNIICLLTAQIHKAGKPFLTDQIFINKYINVFWPILHDGIWLVFMYLADASPDIRMYSMFENAQI